MKRVNCLFRMAMVVTWLAASAHPSFGSGVLAGLGSDDFNVVDSDTPYTQDTNSLTLNAPFSAFGFVGGSFTSIYDWSSISEFSLLMSAPGDSPNKFFIISFLDSTLEVLLNDYQGEASGLSGEPSLVSLVLLDAPGATGDLSAVGGFQFFWEDPSDPGYEGSVQIFGVVPEPSTWALLALGGALGGLGWVRRRRT